LQIVKLVIIQFSSFFSYLFHITSTFSPRHIVLQCLQTDQFLIHAYILKSFLNVSSFPQNKRHKPCGRPVLLHQQIHCCGMYIIRMLS